MIHIDYQNVLRGAIGPKNGLDVVRLKTFLRKNEGLVKKMLSSEDQPGYAFLKLPEDEGAINKIEAFAKKNRKWENIVVLGIGGSALGGIALQDALLGPLHNLGGKPRLFFVDNIDPDMVDALMGILDPRKTFLIVVSKSGGTTEPMALYNVFRKWLEEKIGARTASHWAFVTDPKVGILREWGEREGIAMFDIPPKVGGRFSVLSAAALLPTALAGIDIKKLLSGARTAKKMIRKKTAVDNPALLLACLQYLMDTEKGKIMTVMMPYSNLLFRVADWYRQLLAESIGKNKKVGPTPINALGATDQHSQLQLYNEGPEDKWIVFLETRKHRKEVVLGKNMPKEMKFLERRKMGEILKASYQGTARALAKNGRPNLTLSLDRIDAEILGALFMLLECQVALLGLLYKVDAFDQPGVEESKKITKKILSKS
jgi:glucose-6-phosphate isomerase